MRCMISKSNVKLQLHAMLCASLFSSKQLCNKTGSNKIQFFVISDNQGLQWVSSASAFGLADDSYYLDLDYYGYHKNLTQ